MPQPPKPSMLHVIDGTWQPNEVDRRNGIVPGFGTTVNIINGGLECNKPNGKESPQAKNRIAYYKKFAWYLYVDFENEELGCSNQQQFSAGGAGALPIYWDKDWVSPYSCKLVNDQTAHSALVEGEYIDCVEENFKVQIRWRQRNKEIPHPKIIHAERALDYFVYVFMRQIKLSKLKK